MFKQHNNYSIAIICLLAINVLFAIASLVVLSSDIPEIIGIILILLINLYLLLKCYQQDVIAGKACLWFNLLQIVTISSGGYSLVSCPRSSECFLGNATF
jgi:hypothetical protein